jgi:hypothetical protein
MRVDALKWTTLSRRLLRITSCQKASIKGILHAYCHSYQEVTKGERGDVSCRQRSTAREEGLRLDEIGMLAGLGWANAQVSRAYGLQRIIPLEELATGTSILDMRALPQIKLVIKFPCACRAAHVVIPFCCCVPLLAHGCLIIRNPSSKRLQNICIICLDIGMRSL